MLLLQILNRRNSVSDRYYRVLYDLMLHPEVETCAKSAMFLNVILRSMKQDPVLARVKAVAKRLLQVCQSAQPTFICGSLMVLAEVRCGSNWSKQKHADFYFFSPSPPCSSFFSGCR